MNWTWPWRANLKRENESLLIKLQAVENNAIRTSYINIKIDKRQQNSKCSSCVHKNEIVNYIISWCSKPAEKKFKSKHDWVGKVIMWELCITLRFDQAEKWYMHKPESVRENEMYKIFCNFDGWFLCLMAYQPLQVIQCQSHSPRRTVVVLFNL